MAKNLTASDLTVKNMKQRGINYLRLCLIYACILTAILEQQCSMKWSSLIAGTDNRQHAVCYFESHNYRKAILNKDARLEEQMCQPPHSQNRQVANSN